MKRIILILVLLASLKGFGQAYQQNGTFGINFKRIATESGLTAPKGDTSLNNSLSRGGGLVFKSSNKRFYFHDSTKWKLLLDEDDVVGFDNFANADLTFDNERIHTINGWDLTVQNSLAAKGGYFKLFSGGAGIYGAKNSSNLFTGLQANTTQSLSLMTNDNDRLTIASNGRIRFDNYNLGDSVLTTDGSGNLVGALRMKYSDSTIYSTKANYKKGIDSLSSVFNNSLGNYLPLSGGTLTGGLNMNYATPIINFNSTNNATPNGVEFRDNGTLDAYIKATNNQALLDYSSGRQAGWGGKHSWYTDQSLNMRLNSAGLSIGVAENAVEVLEARSPSATFVLKNTLSTTFSGINFQQEGSLDGYLKVKSNTAEMRLAIGRSFGWGGFATFYIDENEKMRLNSTGLAIGTTTVNYPLTVSGSAKVTSIVDSANSTGGNYKILSSAGADKLQWLQQQLQFVLFEGDSQTAGANTVDSMKTKSANFLNARYINNAVSGNKINDLLARVQTSVIDNKRTDNYTSAYICVYVGTNDAFYSATTSQQVYDSIKTYWAICRSNGYKVIAHTMSDFTGATGATAAVLAKRDTINQMILSDPSLYDYLVRLDVLFPDASNTTYFSGDNLHFTQVGKSLWLTFLNDAISNNRVLSQNNSYVNYKYLSKGDYSNYATLNFASTLAGASSDLTITVPGAVNGDAVSVGVPNGSTLANGVFTAWVSAVNTVTVRFTNTNLLTALDPASGTFKVFVFKN